MNSRCEGIVVLSKLSIICFSSFLHDDGLQLQFALGVMVVNLALHHIYLPFEVSGAKKGKYLEEDAERDTRSSDAAGAHKFIRIMSLPTAMTCTCGLLTADRWGSCC